MNISALESDMRRLSDFTSKIIFSKGLFIGGFPNLSPLDYLLYL